MATYVPVATDPADPVSSRFVGSAAEEFRTLKNRTKGALVVPLTDPVPGFIPAVASRAGKGLGFDGSGNPIVFTISGSADPSLRADLAAAGGVALVNGAVSSSDLQKQTYTAFTTTGTNTAYVLTPTPAITAYLAGESFWVNLHVASGASPTLAISGIATPPNLVQRKGDGTYENVSSLPAGPYRVTLVSATQALVEAPPVIPTNGVATASIADLAVTPAKLSQKITRGTKQNTTSGTAIDFTGIPSWVTRVTLCLSGVSLNGTDNLLVQLGTGSTPQTTGYLGTSVNLFTTPAIGGFSPTTGIGIIGGSAASVLHGTVTLTLLDAATNTWVATIACGRSDGSVGFTGGFSVSLSGSLGIVRLMSSISNTFDAGMANIVYE